MLSPLRRAPQLDPLVKRKIAHVKMLGIPCVVGLFLVAIAALLGYLPKWVFWPATCAEVLLGPYLIGRIHTIRNRS